MQREAGVDAERPGGMADALRLFLLPPLLTFALVAASLFVFASHLTQADLQTIFVVEGVRQAD